MCSPEPDFVLITRAMYAPELRALSQGDSTESKECSALYWCLHQAAARQNVQPDDITASPNKDIVGRAPTFAYGFFPSLFPLNVYITDSMSDLELGFHRVRQRQHCLISHGLPSYGFVWFRVVLLAYSVQDCEFPLSLMLCMCLTVVYFQMHFCFPDGSYWLVFK